MTKHHVILGVDPGTVVTGYGIIRSVGGKWETIDFGTVRPPRTNNTAERYLVIYKAIEHLINEFKPDAVSVESQFVYGGGRGARGGGGARGAGGGAAAGGG